MSKIAVNEITNEAGTGAPSAPHGIQSLWLNSGHIIAHGINNGGTSTLANLYNVRRTLGNKTFNFHNLQFDFNTADKTNWTDPGSSRKWTYVYIDPETEDFFVSDNHPNFGENTITISGNTVLYMFSIYADDTDFYDFHLAGSLYGIMAMEAKQGYSSNYTEGLTLYYNQSLSSLNVNIDVSGDIPKTASFVELSMLGQRKYRNDSGGFSRVSSRVLVTRKNDTNSGDILLTDRRIAYIDTPVEGSYYPKETYGKRSWFNSLNLDFTDVTIQYEGGNSGYSDGLSNIAFNLHSFIDRGVI